MLQKHKTRVHKQIPIRLGVPEERIDHNAVGL